MIPFDAPTQTPQELRKAALNWQLMALNAQAQAITAIAAEHRIDLADIAPELLCAQAKDVVASAIQIHEAASAAELGQTLTEIKNLRALTEQLKCAAGKFSQLADFRAQFRLSASIDVLATPDTLKAYLIGSEKKQGDSTTDPSEESQSASSEPLVRDSGKLKACAEQRCYHAESEQNGTFSLQIQAICDLALEMVFVAASQKAAISI